MVRCKIISKQLVVYCCTHQDYADIGMLSYDSFYGEENEISVDVSFMHLIENNERKLFEELGAVNQSLQEDAVSNKYYSTFRSYL